MTEIERQLRLFAGAAGGRALDALDTAALARAVAQLTLAHIAPAWERSRTRHAEGRRAYYLSAEYLVGQQAFKNLWYTGLARPVDEALAHHGRSTQELRALPDPGLGNGGLGRLAACYLDSAATLGLPLDGYGLRYRHGLFAQSFAHGAQVERPDDWLAEGDPWSVRRADEAVTVPYPEGAVRAVPYDMPVIGYGGRHVCTLRLWQAEPLTPFDLSAFGRGQYGAASRAAVRAADLCRVLYPNDATEAGRRLRLRQQYLLASASMQDMLRRFMRRHGGDLRLLPQYVALQLNDTHPVIAVPELYRLLLAHGLSHPQALAVVCGVFRYTNHTVMPEALEKWPLDAVRRVSAPCARIVRRMAAVQQAQLDRANVSPQERAGLLFLQGDTVHMAYLACFVSSKINGVAKLHTQILRERVLAPWERAYPGRIVNVTNGITPRRFVALADPALSSLITERLGDERWLTDLTQLSRLRPDADDPDVLRRFLAVKAENKRRLAAEMLRRDGITVDPSWLFDVQIKRLHEYKRQLLNILCILETFFSVREGRIADMLPTVFLFGGKAAPGYARAKAVIRLIHAVADLIRTDERARAVMQVAFVSDYDVSYAEQIVAAADVSVQISTAGTEASGTGNMKLMVNGAVTLGTYDGANIEIVRAAGEENAYIFGLRVEDIRRMEQDYSPRALYESDPRLRRCLDALTDGTLDDGGSGAFAELRASLLDGASWHRPDAYFVLADFAACLSARERLQSDCRDPLGFAARGWKNIAAAGAFSSDRAVREYAEKIWQIRKTRQK